MMAFQATAEGGDRCAVVIDKGLWGEKMTSCEQWLNSEVGRRDNPVEVVVSHPKPPLVLEARSTKL
jgi:hypothetical protein